MVDLGLTQAELAERAGLSQPSVQALRCSAEWLESGAGPSPTGQDEDIEQVLSSLREQLRAVEGEDRAHLLELLAVLSKRTHPKT